MTDWFGVTLLAIWPLITIYGLARCILDILTKDES